jgi:hypothetical protein
MSTFEAVLERRESAWINALILTSNVGHRFQPDCSFDKQQKVGTEPFLTSASALLMLKKGRRVYRSGEKGKTIHVAKE